MTGRELILYILENHLEDIPMFDTESIFGLMSLREAAAKFDVGYATMDFWYKRGIVSGYKIGDSVYFRKDMPDPRKNPGEVHAVLY